ncbi:MAG TPA: cupin domain-containing protein [Myxococcaceae bacterium]|nr:cupin domain-containing protein [Myxococcaceae bacterium]
MTGVQLGRLASLERTGINLFRLSPGRESFVYHAHDCEEEWLYVLSGVGTLEMDGVEHPIGPGDFVGFPAPSVAHQMRNTGGGDDLVYLVGGEHRDVEVARFPKHGKRMVRVGNRIDIYSDEDAEPFGPARYAQVKRTGG